MFKCVSLLIYWNHRNNIIHNSMNIKNTSVQIKSISITAKTNIKNLCGKDQ